MEVVCEAGEGEGVKVRMRVRGEDGDVRSTEN